MYFTFFLWYREVNRALAGDYSFLIGGGRGRRPDARGPGSGPAPAPCRCGRGLEEPLGGVFRGGGVAADLAAIHEGQPRL